MVESNVGGGCFVTIDGKRFFYVKASKKSRRQAAKDAELHEGEVIAARERAAGRALTERERVHGVEHPETRSIREQIMDNAPVQSNANPPDHSDWAAQRLAWLRQNPGIGPEEKAERKRRIEQLEQIVAEQQTKAEASEVKASPKVQQAIAHGKAVLDDLKFDPTATAADIEQAQKRLYVAESGDHTGYWKTVKVYIDQRDAKALAAAEHEFKKAETYADRAKQIVENGRVPPDVAEEMALQEGQE